MKIRPIKSAIIFHMVTLGLATWSHPIRSFSSTKYIHKFQHTRNCHKRVYVRINSRFDFRGGNRVRGWREGLHAPSTRSSRHCGETRMKLDLGNVERKWEGESTQESKTSAWRTAADRLSRSPFFRLLFALLTYEGCNSHPLARSCAPLRRACVPQLRDPAGLCSLLSSLPPFFPRLFSPMCLSVDAVFSRHGFATTNR